jgi:Na+/H+ antiporter NhaA
MEQTRAFSEKTAWARNLASPLRDYLRTETGSAVVLLAAALAALAWVNAHTSSYEDVWTTTLSIRIGGTGVSEDLRHWVDNGLMVFFFFVVGLEARREFDIGELRERRRLLVPVVAALGGMALAVALFLAFNAGKSSAHGWGAAMSTDTAFALGLLALTGPRFPSRLRALMLTLLVVDDLVSLVVLGTVYTENIAFTALGAALGLFALLVAIKLLRNVLPFHSGLLFLGLGVALWVAVLKSGVDPVVVGLAMGLLVFAYPAERTELEQATERFRLFREQPTPELARSARSALQSALSPNERLQELFHPWSSYVIVPLFALANAGIVINGDFLGKAFTSPITLGILVGYVAGKPLGIMGASWLAGRMTMGRFKLPVGFGALAVGGSAAGIGFTVSILISNHAFHGERLREAKLGVLAAAVSAALVAWLCSRALAALPERLRLRLVVGRAELIVDLAETVDPETDHIRGPRESPVTLVEYGDFECPNCGQAEPVVRELLSDFADLRYVWRHLPLNDVHPRAQLAAEASEAADGQGAFWEMHDLLFEHQDALTPSDLVRYAGELGLDVEDFAEFLRKRKGAGKVALDVDGADLSGVTGTPTFFVNGRRLHGAYDIDTLSAAVRGARARALVAVP